MKRFVSLLVAAMLLIACLGVVPAVADEKKTISFLDISPRDAREAYFTKPSPSFFHHAVIYWNQRRRYR